jgi:FkbM family methyltransferase
MNVKRISHAQTGQDVLVDFLLKRHGIIPRAGEFSGFYVDLGCAYPIKSSNTYFFYERGWQGVCVDANPDAEEEFRRVRPRDTFVNSGVGGEAGSMEFFIFENPQHNTFNAARAAVSGRKIVRSLPVPIDTLASILSRHVPEGRTIEFLSMDIEGLEKVALEGMDWSRHRPRIVLIEAFGSLETISDAPETGVLVRNGYRMLAFTGHDAAFIDTKAD